MKTDEIVVRLIVRDGVEIKNVLEQRIPKYLHDVQLLMRRAPFRNLVSSALLMGYTAYFEVRK